MIIYPDSGPRIAVARYKWPQMALTAEKSEDPSDIVRLTCALQLESMGYYWMNNFRPWGHVILKTWDVANVQMLPWLLSCGLITETLGLVQAGYACAKICALDIGYIADHLRHRDYDEFYLLQSQLKKEHEAYLAALGQ